MYYLLRIQCSQWFHRLRHRDRHQLHHRLHNSAAPQPMLALLLLLLLLPAAAAPLRMVSAVLPAVLVVLAAPVRIAVEIVQLVRLLLVVAIEKACSRVGRREDIKCNLVLGHSSCGSVRIC